MRAAKRIVSVKRFSDLNVQRGDAEKFVKRAKPILLNAMIDALAKYKIIAKVKMTAHYNGLISVQVKEDNLAARKAKRNFLMVFTIAGDRIMEFQYSGPVPITPQFVRNVIPARKSPIKISNVVGSMWARKDDMILSARQMQEEAMQIATFDERVIYALEAFRVKQENILKEVVI